MKPRRLAHSLRPLTSSLARFKTIVGMAAALGFASQQSASAAPISWEGASGGTPGDGLLWLDPLNWQGDVLPAVIDDLTFGTGILGDIQLGTNQTANSLTFTTNTDLGVYGESNILTNVTGNVSVATGSTVVINANLGGTTGLSLSGGGTLQLTNPLNSFTGNISVSGAGTTLLATGFAQPAAVNRSDVPVLGQTSRTITLTNGGTFKIAGNSFNPDGTVKIFNFGAGGGTINVAAGFQHFSIDDAGQITSVAGSSLTKTGKGALQILTQDYNLDLSGGVSVNGGLLRLSRVQGNTGGSRFSAFTAATPITVNNGGALVLETGTVGILDNALTVNSGGIIAVNGVDNEFGVRSGAPTSLTLNGGTILVREGFNPQTAGINRFPRINSVIGGSGNVDVIGATGNAINTRLVVQRGDVGSTFSGTWTLHGNVVLEANPRNNDVTLASAYAGNPIGNASTVDLRGHNPTFDFRNSGGVATRDAGNLITGWNSNTDIAIGTNLTLSGEAGSLGRFAVIHGQVSNNTGSGAAPAAGIAPNVNIAGGVNQTFGFGTLSLGNHRLYYTNGNDYDVRFSGVTLTGPGVATPIIELNASNGRIQLDGVINEHVAGDGLIRQGRNGQLDISNAVNLSNVTLRTLETRLFGANGAIGVGSLSGTGSITVNSGASNVTANNASTGTILHLNNNLGSTGGLIGAATNANRLGDNVTLNLLGDSTLRLTSQNNVGVAETTGPVNIVGRPTIDLVKTGTTTSPVVLTLGSAPTLSPGSSLNVTGTNLGGATADSSRVIIPGVATTSFLGSNITSGNEWARYDDAVDGTGFARGVIAFTNAEYGLGLNALETDWAAGMHVKQNGATGLVLSAPRSVGTLNLQFSAASQSINTNGNLLTVEQGGVLVSTNTAGIIGGPAGGITAGTSASPATLTITNNSQLDLNAKIDNNSFGGAVTLVKNGTGILRLTNQGHAVGGGVGAVGSIAAATHTNTFTGGIVINQGRLVVWRPEYLGANTITLNGGALDLDVPVAPGATNTVLNFGNNVVINANSGLYSDDNAEANDASAGGNATFALGSLTVNGSHIVGFGTFGNGQASAAASGGSATDFRFSGANFSGTPTFQMGGFRSGNATLIVQGNLAGSGFNVEATGNAIGAFQLGSGGTDNVANTYAGTISLIRTSGDGDAILRLDKANGTTAITGDVIINGGTLAWGTGAVLDKNANVTIGPNAAPGGVVANQWTGNSNATAFVNTTSGNHQIADNANITLMFGTLNESGRLVHEKFGTLRQLNGNFNTGTGVIEVDTYEMSGGVITFNSGGTFKAGTVNLLSGAQDINVGNAFSGAASVFQVGSGGITINGQNLSVGNGDYFTPSAGGVLKLGGNMTVQADPLNFTSTDRQRGIFSGGGGREHGPNFIDLDGGNRTISISGDIFYTFNVGLRNGGLIKEGDGSLAIQNWNANNFSGGVTVNNGILLGRSATAMGSGPVDVNGGGTLKMDGGWTWGNAITLSGAGADLPESGGVLEQGAFVSEAGANRLTGNVSIDGGATVATNFYAIPNTANQGVTSSGVGGASPYIKSSLRIEGAGGITGTGTLTLSGGGDGTIVNGVNTTGSVVLNGGGTWTLGGGTYTGTTEIQAGVLRAVANSSLGSSASGTTVRSGATLLLDGSVSSAEPLNIAGNGYFGNRGALESEGTNTLSGNVTLSADATIRSNAGVLTLGGSVTGGKVITLSGAGNGAITGNIVNSVPSGSALIKNGTGTWTLQGNNSIGGSTRINGGTLALNSSGAALSNTANVQLAGGHLANLGAAQTIGGLDLLAGGANVSGGAGLNVGAISRSAGATVNFGGSVTTSTANGANGILGGWATFGSNWATGGGAVGAFSTYTTLANRTGTIGTGNHGLVTYDSGGHANGVHTAAITGETLKIGAGVTGLQTAAQTVSLAAGGILKDGNQVFNLGGGLVSGATPDSELNVHVMGGGLYVSSPLIGGGTGSLNKSGPGDLRLFGTSNFTGSVNVNGGTLSVPGQVNHPGALGAGVTNANRTLNLNGGTFAVVAGDYDLNDFDGVTAGVQSMQIVVGPAGGTLHSGTGNILINDAGQFAGSGDLRITGGGRVSLDTTYPNFTGDITVAGGTLRLSGGVASNQNVNQKVTLEPNTALIIAGDMSQSFEFQGNNQISVLTQDRQIRGPVSFNGNIHISMTERDAVNNARSLQFAGPVSGSGTINITGVNTNGRVQFAGGFSDYSGTVNVGPNAAIEIRQPGSMGTDLAAPVINLNGSRSRLMLRHYENGDWNLDVNANGKFAEIYAGRLDSYGLGTQGIYSIRSLTASANNYLTFNGDNSNWATVNGAVNAAGDAVLVTNTNTLFRQGATIGGFLDKRGPSVLAVEGPLAVAGKTVIQQGWIDLRGSAGKLVGTTGVEIRGGNLMLSNNSETGSDPNRIAGIPISLGGGSLRVVGTTNLGTLSLAPGTSEINYAMDTQSGITPLVINDVGATRAIGSQLRINSTFGTIGNPTNTGTNPRIHVTGMADTFGSGAVGSADIIPYMVFSNNFEFVGYRTTSDGGQALGLVQIGNGSMRADAADGTGAGQLRSATAPNEIMRFTSNTTTTLGGNATWRAIKMDGSATRTIALGGNTLTVDRGHIIFVSNNEQRIGVAAAGSGTLTSGNNELHITANQSTSIIGAVIANGPAGAVHLVKNGAGALRLDGAADNTFTGNVHLNGGVLVNNRLGHIPAGSTVFFNGGRWEPNPVAALATDVLAQNNYIVVNSKSAITDQATLSLDNGGGVQDNDIAFGSVTINNGMEWSIAGWDSVDGIFNATPANPHVFNGVPTIQLFQGRTATAASESTFTFAGPITGGGFYVSSIGGRAATNPNDVTLNIGGGAGDTVANSYAGEVTILGTGATNNFPTVRLNKAAGTTAISGNLTINGGQVILQAANQIADSADVVVNGDSSGSNPFSLQLNNNAETINNLTINGGGVQTGTGSLTANNVTVNGGSASADNLQINSNGGTVTVNGSLTVGDFGRITLGASNATLVVNGGLQMNGGSITQNSGGGANIVRLNSGVTATSSVGQSALLGNSTDSDTFLEVNGSQVFNVADGPQGNDLAVSAVVRNSTVVGAPAGGIIKSGPGLMVLQGGATANTYSGPTVVSAGTLDLNKNGGIVAVAGSLTVGGSGNPAVVRLRANDQIANASDVALGADGTLDLQTFNTSDTVGSLSGTAGSSILLGPSSALSVTIASDVEFAGNITGGGAENAITKNGAGKWTLSGVNEFVGNLVANGGIVDVVGSLNGSAVVVNNGATLQGSGSVADVFAAAGGTVSGGSGVGELEVRNIDLSLGTLSATIEGNTFASTYDVINASGTVTLGGTLNLAGSYVPSLSDSLYLIVNGGTNAISGTFAGINQMDFVTVNGVQMQATYTADFEGNNPYSSTGNDFALIPEPGSASLLLGGLGSLLAMRRRRRNA